MSTQPQRNSIQFAMTARGAVAPRFSRARAARALMRGRRRSRWSRRPSEAAALCVARRRSLRCAPLGRGARALGRARLTSLGRSLSVGAGGADGKNRPAAVFLFVSPSSVPRRFFPLGRHGAVKARLLRLRYCFFTVYMVRCMYERILQQALRSRPTTTLPTNTADGRRHFYPSDYR